MKAKSSFMDPRKAMAYFQGNYRLHVSTNGFFTFDCPICGGKLCRAVSFRGNFIKCFKGCTDDMDVIDFVAEVEGTSRQEAEGVLWRLDISKIDLNILIENTDEKAGRSFDSGVTLPEGFQTILSGEGLIARRAQNYMRNRGFDLRKLDQKGYGYTTHRVKDPKDKNKDYFGYIIVPFRKDGALIYYLGRTFMNQEPRYKNPPEEWVGVGKSDVIYNQDALYTYNKCYILEGAFDAECLSPRATATLGWSLSETQAMAYLMAPCEKFVFVPDLNDTPGEDLLKFYYRAVKTAVRFLEAGKRVKVINLSSLQDYGKDVNEIGAFRVLALEKETPELTWGKAVEILSNAA